MADSSERFVCGYVIEFTDGGEAEEQVLGRGTLKECERIYTLMPGIAYSGSRPVKSAYFTIVPDPEVPRG